MNILIGSDEGRIPKGTRIKKINSDPKDAHQDGAEGTIVAALGPISATQRAEAIIALSSRGIDGDVEFIYWIEWDDIPGVPVATTDNRIEPLGGEDESHKP